MNIYRRDTIITIYNITIYMEDDVGIEEFAMENENEIHEGSLN